MITPVRIQLSRQKGWRMPPNTIKVDRTTRWGNPFTVADAIDTGYAGKETVQQFVVDCFRDWIGLSSSGRNWWQGPVSDLRRAVIINEIGFLKGKNLACWCRPDQPCHADVLLHHANIVCSEVTA